MGHVRKGSVAADPALEAAPILPPYHRVHKPQGVPSAAKEKVKKRPSYIPQTS